MPFLGSLYYARSESAPPVRGAPLVLLHGAGSSHLVWPPGLRRMPGRTVDALDWPGHGRSEGVACPTITDLADTAADWARRVWLPKAVWCGHSMGAAAALELAARHPERVAALVLIGAGMILPVEEGEAERCADPRAFPEMVDGRLNRLLEADADRTLRSRIRESLSAVRPSVWQRDLNACGRWSMTGRAGGVRAPALVIAGMRDRMVPCASARALAGALPDARLVEIPEAGHLCMLERGLEVTTAVGRFLDGLTDEAEKLGRPSG